MAEATILILEDNVQRRDWFEASVRELGDFRVRFWIEASSMIQDLPEALPDAVLISLDHDLNDTPGNPGTGLDVATALAQMTPTKCAVIIHTTNHLKRPSMERELHDGKWETAVVGPIGDDWIRKSWEPKARELIKLCKISEPDL